MSLLPVTLEILAVTPAKKPVAVFKLPVLFS